MISQEVPTVTDSELPYRQATDLVLSTDERVVLFRRHSVGRGPRWEASEWSADRVATGNGIYTYAKLHRIGQGFTRWGAMRAMRKMQLLED